jgi:hypothetical protein
VGGHVSAEEFWLFLARAKTDADLDRTVRRILAWRKIGGSEQAEVIRRAKARLGKIEGNHTYATSFHGCDLLLERVGSALKVIDGKTETLRRKVAQVAGEPPPPKDVELYADKREWIAAHGDPDSKLSLHEAIERAIDRSDGRRAVALYKKLPAQARGRGSVEKFKTDLFREIDLENFLETRLHLIEKKLKPVPGKVRQHWTPIGTFDLFAEAQNGDLVVIELKKVHAADQVFGQLCRYMGYAQVHYAAKGQKVRGYIVGSEIDAKLHYAAKVTPMGKVRLQKFRRDSKTPGNIWIEVATEPPV